MSYSSVLVTVMMLLAASSAGISFSRTQNNTVTYDDTSKLLLRMSSPGNSDAFLAVLFAMGDERIQDLIRALNDPREGVRHSAQVVIRYLGNDAGMKALLDNYEKQKVYSVAGPIPLPLRDWDYEYINQNYAKQPSRWDQRATSYIYALALDGSPKASALLTQLSESVRKSGVPYHYALQQVSVLQRDLTLPWDADLVKFVSENAFFLDSTEQLHKAKLIAFTHSKDKALIEAYESGVPPAEVFHIVLQRQFGRWKFLSVTRVSAS